MTTDRPIVRRDGTVEVGGRKIGRISRRVVPAGVRTYRALYTGYSPAGAIVSQQYHRRLVVDALVLRDGTENA